MDNRASSKKKKPKLYYFSLFSLSLDFYKLHFFNSPELDSVVMSLPSDQEVPGSIPASIVFFNGYLFLFMYRFVVSVFFVHILPYVLFRRSLHYNDHRSVEGLQLCPCS